MATVVKHHPEQVQNKPGGDVNSTYSLPCKQLAVEVADQHHCYLPGCNSPRSVIGDHARSGNSSYYFSCSSSSSAERASTMTDPQHQGPRPLRVVDRHLLAEYNKLKPQQHHFKESSCLQRMTASSTGMDIGFLNLKKAHMESGQQGHHLALRDVHNDVVLHKDLPSYGQEQQFLNSCQTSLPFGCYVTCDSRGLPLTSEDEGMKKSSLSRYQDTPLNSLINTLMQQYQPPVAVEHCKTARQESLNEVFAGICHGSLVTNPKSNGSIHDIPLFKDRVPTLVIAEQQRFSLHQPSYDKVKVNSFEFQPHAVQADPNMWGKGTLQNEVEKLTDAVNCAQACLERIQPIRTPRNNINLFQAQGDFLNRSDRTMPQGALQNNTHMDLQMTNSGLGSSHNLVASTSNRDFFMAPMKVDKQPRAHNGTGFLETKASQKYHQRPIGAQNGTKPWIEENGFTKVGEHFHVQRAEKSGHTKSSTGCMMDASTEITPTVSHRDMGTQMTPIGSSRHSTHPNSPRRGTLLSPPRHNSPMKMSTSVVLNVGAMIGVEAEKSHKAKLRLDALSGGDQVQRSLGKSFDSNWSSREEEEEDIGKSLRQPDLEDLKKDVLEARATAWKEATRLKVLARFEREETKIRTWEDLQTAKAEADLKKLEMKLEKQRVRMAAKIASRLDASHRKAEERRAAAKANKLQALERTADKIHHEATLRHHANHPLCACFSQSFG